MKEPLFNASLFVFYVINIFQRLLMFNSDDFPVSGRLPNINLAVFKSKFLPKQAPPEIRTTKESLHVKTSPELGVRILQ